MKEIDSEALAQRYRELALDVGNKKILLTNFSGTQQENDLTLPPNCDGFGRVHHFYRSGDTRFPSNPLPMNPALSALGLPSATMLQAQVFQNSVCNWRCWYCYVPFSSLRGDKKFSRFISTDELVELYLAESSPSRVIDLSGGQPEITPEWVLWFIESLKKYNLEDKVYLWSDDNLSNDYFWRYLSPFQISQIAEFSNYGRVGCFKGFDSESFAFNTRASIDHFDQQFELMNRYIASGLDMYGYLTVTTPSRNSMRKKMSQFIDSLQRIHENLPLRVIPLEIKKFSSNIARITPEHESAIENQFEAVSYWIEEIMRRFSSDLRNSSINSIAVF